jgi:hypothetical protein
MAKISTYPTQQPTIDDVLIGTDVENLLITKNFLISDIIALVPTTTTGVTSLNTGTGSLSIVGIGGVNVTRVGQLIKISHSISTKIPLVIGATPGGSSTIATLEDVDIIDINWTGGSGTYTLTLPSAKITPYVTVAITSDGYVAVANMVDIAAAAGETINGSATYTMNSAYASIFLWSDSINWRIIQ